MAAGGKKLKSEKLKEEKKNRGKLNKKRGKGLTKAYFWVMNSKKNESQSFLVGLGSGFISRIRPPCRSGVKCGYGSVN